ncbi:MAG: hypothetical protein R6V05_11395, partial [Candidatus Brocadiia bacterium]
IPAIEAQKPDYEQLVSEQARIAGQKLDLAMARYYLERSPQMAAPFLEAVGERGGETGAWAKAELERLQQRKEAAEQDELLAVQDQLRAVRAAAERLHQLTARGEMEAGRRAQQELTDARLRLQVQKAEFALARGNWQKADDILKAAPADSASEKLLDARFRPLRNRVSRAMSAAAELEAARQALDSGDVGGAAARLRAAGADAELVEPLATKRQVLADAIAPLRQAEAMQQELAAIKQRLMADARQRIAALQQRQQAWQRYRGGVEALLAGRLEDARKHLSAAMGMEGIHPMESDAGAAVLAEMAEADRPAIEQAQAALADARRMVRGEAYAQAADALRSLRQMAGYELSERIRQSAEELHNSVQAAEAEAERLYKQAVQARQDGDRAQVRRLLRRLKADYTGTAFYQARL